MQNRSSKKSGIKRILAYLFGAIAVILIAAALLWKIPFHLKLKSIDVPDGCEEIATKIELSDVYWLHIIGNRVIKYDGSLEAVKQYILQNNSEKQLENISVRPFFTEWDDYAVSPNDYEVDNSEKYKYTVIQYFYKFE